MAHLKDFKEELETKILNGHDRYTLDYERDVLVLPLHPLRSWRPLEKEIEELMSEGYLGAWFKERGFEPEIYVADYAYTTKPTYDSHSCTTYRGHTAYLRNRVTIRIFGK